MNILDEKCTELLKFLNDNHYTTKPVEILPLLKKFNIPDIELREKLKFLMDNEYANFKETPIATSDNYMWFFTVLGGTTHDKHGLLSLDKAVSIVGRIKDKGIDYIKSLENDRITQENLDLTRESINKAASANNIGSMALYFAAIAILTSIWLPQLCTLLKAILSLVVVVALVFAKIQSQRKLKQSSKEST